MFKPRPRQADVLAYTGGRMGVSAVPGSGKTQTLSALAARLIAGGFIDDDQEVLVVTLVNSAVDNFSNRVGSMVEKRGLLAHMGYRVRTLHGLAHDIVAERPGLVGLSDRFQIIDERDADLIREGAALAWLHSNPYAFDDYFNPDLEEKRSDWVRREQLPGLVGSIALNFIRYAKDHQQTPSQVRQRLDQLPLPLPLAEMGWAIYSDYQRALTYRGAVDFDDLIRLALQALKEDPQMTARLRDRWPYILEDEAQDSSNLQEAILGELAGPEGNRVRVGDPNQAIYETFTTASPRHLLDFLASRDVIKCDLPDSGRSSVKIIDLANFLVDWTHREHPWSEARTALVGPPYIQPTQPDDPQPNPPEEESSIQFITRKLSPEDEIQWVAADITQWLPKHQDRTVAVLVPRNQRGNEVVTELKRRGIEVNDNLMRSSHATRITAGAVGNLLNYLSDPQSAAKLARAYRVWKRADLADADTREPVERTAKLLGNCHQVEDFLHPLLENDWLESLELPASENELYDNLVQFRAMVQRWQKAILLPIDQIILTLAQDLFSEPSDLALAHKIALVLRQASDAHQDWRLPELTQELAEVARNERKFLGFSEDDSGFDPERYRGKVIVATMHKAKGLEWDRVYLLSANNYDFPSGMPYDQYISERWYLRPNLNLEAETLAQFDTLYLKQDAYDWYEEGRATLEARREYVSERLRLLYVGITRAKRDLIVTWNTGRRADLQIALPVVALQAFWEGGEA